MRAQLAGCACVKSRDLLNYLKMKTVIVSAAIAVLVKIVPFVDFIYISQLLTASIFSSFLVVYGCNFGALDKARSRNDYPHHSPPPFVCTGTCSSRYQIAADSPACHRGGPGKQDDMLSTSHPLAPTIPATGRPAGAARPSVAVWDARSTTTTTTAVGVWTSSEIPSDVVIGPTDNSVLKFGDYVIEEPSHPVMTEVKYDLGRIVSAREEHTNDWMKSTAAARHDHEQNLSAERRADGLVVFRSTRRVLKGEELRVWFAPELAATLGVPLHVGSYEDQDGFFVCPDCRIKFRYPNALKSHLRQCLTRSTTDSITVRPLVRTERGRRKSDDTTPGSAFRRVTPRSHADTSSSFRTSPKRLIDPSVSHMDTRSCESVLRNNTVLATNRESDLRSAFTFPPKPNVALNTRISPKEKVGLRGFLKASSPPSTHPGDKHVTCTMTSSEATRKDSGVLFSVEKMLNNSSSKRTDEQTSGVEIIKPSPGLDKNANSFNPLALRSQLSIPTAMGQYRPLDPYGHFPIRCFQPVIPSITRYGSILTPALQRGLYSSSAHPYFPYKVPIPTPLKFAHPPHPVPPPNEIDVPKYAGLDRNHLPIQGASSSFQVGETQYSYLQEPGRKNKRGHLCIYCGKLYSRKYGLKIHLRTHTGYKPLKCKVCLRPFGDPSNLNKHIRLHAEGDTPYRCDYCGKVLVRRRDLDRHIRSRHPAEAQRRDSEKQKQDEEEKAAEMETNRATPTTEEGEDEEEEMSPMTSPGALNKSPFVDACIDVTDCS